MRFGFALLLLTSVFVSTQVRASFPEIIIVGEDHFDATSAAYKRRAIENAASGESWLLLEGFYQSDRSKLELDLRNQEVQNTSQIEGLESPVPYALAVMFKLHEDLASLLSTTLRPDQISPVSHQILDHIRGGFVRFFYENEAAYASWKKYQDTPGEKIGHEPEIENLRNAILQRESRSTAPIIRGLIYKDEELLKRVFQFQNYVRKFAAFLAQDQATHQTGARRDTILRFGSFFTQMGVSQSATQDVWLDWRNEEFAHKALAAYPSAQAAGVPLVLIVGQLHVNGIQELLRQKLPRGVSVRTKDSRILAEVNTTPAISYRTN